jgi:hypothetical protein
MYSQLSQYYEELDGPAVSALGVRSRKLSNALNDQSLRYYRRRTVKSWFSWENWESLNNLYIYITSINTRGVWWNVKAKQRSQKSVVEWVTKILALGVRVGVRQAAGR